MAKNNPLEKIAPGMKVTAQMSPEPSEADLQFAKQMDVEYVVLWTNGANANYDYFMSRREIFENAGLKIYGFGNGDVHNQDGIVLNLENRDAKIEQYKNYIRDLGRAGIPYTTYAHMGNGIWSTERETTRGGASARAFNLKLHRKGIGVVKSIRCRFRTDASIVRRRFGITIPTSSSRLRRLRRKQA